MSTLCTNLLLHTFLCYLFIIICINIILQTDADKQISEGEKRKLTLAETRRSLPVYKFRDAFIDAVREHQVLIVEGDTGSGKTTQLTQYLYESVSFV
jgi:HrpA-like RNA helicase